MTPLERIALEHVAAELRYQRSPRARRDREADKARRSAADRSAGHLPACTLSRCCSACKRAA